jgi:hypothetical protein
MKLNETLVIHLPSSADPKTPMKDYPVSEVTVVHVMDDFTRKTVTARLKNFPFAVKLWGKDEYDAAQWTNETAQARAEELLPDAAALKALIPAALKQYNP